VWSCATRSGRPLASEETEAYVRERLLVAGHDTGEVFTTSALRAVHRQTRGIPRIINVLCDNALLIAFGRQSLRVAASVIEEAATDLGLDEPLPRVAAPPTKRKRKQKRGVLARLWPRRRATAELGL
jgi:hypothetical protein